MTAPPAEVQSPTGGGWGRGSTPSGAIQRYALVGGFNTAVDVSLFTVFTNLVGLPPLAANAMSTVLTLCVSYLLNRVFVFRSDRRHGRTLAAFVAVTLTSAFVVQSVVIWAVIHAGEAAGADSSLLAPFAKIVATGVGMVSNFLGYRWLFSARRSGASVSPRVG